jgi:hypothetical protein
MANKKLNLVAILSLILTFSLFGSALAVEGKPIGEVSSFYGDVKDRHKGEVEWIPAKLGLDIYQYDTVKTEKKSKVRITFEDGSLLNLSEDTELEIKEHIYTPEEKRRVSLFAMLRGKMRVFCQRFAGRGSRFQVETPTAVIGIRGTEFIIWVVSNELTVVICLEDEVFVRNVDKKVVGEVILKPNQMTKVGVGVPPLEPTIVPEELRHQLEIDTTAYKVSPSSAYPEAAEVKPAVAEAEEVEEVAPPTPSALDVLTAEETQTPELPPFPQDPGEVPEHKPPILPEPPGLPGHPY